jgi:hypothetical protein
MKPVRKGLKELKYVGDNKMKTKIKLRKTLFIVPLVIILHGISLTTSFWAQANTSFASKDKVIKPIDIEMKCYVELVGGGETIRFTNTPYRNIKELTHVLMGQKIKLNSESSGKTLYKVKECVPLKDKFKGRRAQQLFLDTPQ